MKKNFVNIVNFLIFSNQQSAISNQQSAISNQQSAISNQQSAITLHCGLLTSCSEAVLLLQFRSTET
jgi:hypothetical protein